MRAARRFASRGTPREGHVRFSVWDESGRAEAAVSIDEEEARRLAGFVAGPSRHPSLLERLGL
jgi:hypothetical protein